MLSNDMVLKWWGAAILQAVFGNTSMHAVVKMQQGLEVHYLPHPTRKVNNLDKTYLIDLIQVSNYFESSFTDLGHPPV